MANPNPKFLRNVPRNFIREQEDPVNHERYSVVTVLGDKESSNGSVKMRVDPEQIFPSADKNGRAIPYHFNVRMDPDKDVEVTYQDQTGNIVRGTRSPAELSQNWARNQSEYAERQGAKVWLNGVSPEMIHESKVPEKGADGKATGRFLLNVSVADPESVPKPGKESGYGSFLVNPDAVTDTQKGDKKNIYLGRENDTISGYTIYNGSVGPDGKDGKDSYTRVPRTAGEIKTQYENDIAAYKARQAETKAPEKAAESEGVGLGE